MRKSHGDPEVHTITGAWGSELTLLEFRSGQLNSSRTSWNSQPPMTLHPIDDSGRSLCWLVRRLRVTPDPGRKISASRPTRQA